MAFKAGLLSHPGRICSAPPLLHSSHIKGAIGSKLELCLSRQGTNSFAGSWRGAWAGVRFVWFSNQAAKVRDRTPGQFATKNDEEKALCNCSRREIHRRLLHVIRSVDSAQAAMSRHPQRHRYPLGDRAQHVCSAEPCQISSRPDIYIESINCGDRTQQRSSNRCRRWYRRRRYLCCSPMLSRCRHCPWLWLRPCSHHRWCYRWTYARHGCSKTDLRCGVSFAGGGLGSYDAVSVRLIVPRSC